MGIGYDYQSSGFRNLYLQPGGDPLLPQQFVDPYQDFYERVFPTGHLLPARFAFVQETTRFRQLGPAVFRRPAAPCTPARSGLPADRSSPGRHSTSTPASTSRSLPPACSPPASSGSTASAKRRDFSGSAEWANCAGIRSIPSPATGRPRNGRVPVPDHRRRHHSDRPDRPAAGQHLRGCGRRGLCRRPTRIVLVRSAGVPPGAPLRSPAEFGMRIRQLRARRLRGVLRIQRPHLPTRSAAQFRLVEAHRLRHHHSRLEVRLLDGLAVLAVRGQSRASTETGEASGRQGANLEAYRAYSDRFATRSEAFSRMSSLIGCRPALSTGC